MKRTILFFLISIITAAPLRSQDSTATEESPEAVASLLMMTGIIVPLAAAGTAISFIPPSAGLVTAHGVTYGALSFESGIGYGERRETGVFSDYRLSLNYTHIYHRKVRDVFRLEATKDFHFEYIDRRKIFLEGCHVGAGFLTDFPNHGYTLSAGLWLKSPWINFFGLFPSHTYGITYRYNKYFSGGSFQQISIGMTSSFTLERPTDSP